MLYDEYQIRRKSLELGIPVLSTIELAESFVKTLEWLQKMKHQKILCNHIEMVKSQKIVTVHHLLSFHQVSQFLPLLHPFFQLWVKLIFYSNFFCVV